VTTGGIYIQWIFNAIKAGPIKSKDDIVQLGPYVGQAGQVDLKAE